MLGYLRAGSKRTKIIWLVVTVATVFTFLLGFNFMAGMGRDSSLAARQSGVFGQVNDEKVTRDMWTNALSTAREQYKQRYGSEPVDRDLKSVQQQAWHNLVTERLLAQQARAAGLKATDNEVVVGMRTNPPQILLAAPAFQTDGKFDPSKYTAALRNPNMDWSPFEEQERAELPIHKLQEGLMSSLKISELELRQEWRDRLERLSATILLVPPADSGSSSGSEAELKAVFDKYRSRMASPARTQLELLAVPIQFSPEEIKTATDLAKGLCDRARKGEDFAQLAKDYSEGPNASKGGAIDRFMNPAELGPIGQSLAAHQPGDILEPYREGSSVMVFKLLDPKADSTVKGYFPGAVRLAEIVVRIRPGADGLRTQYQAALKLAERAKAVGLSRAATEKGLSTQKTQYFDANNIPPQLYATPEAGDWGLYAKKGEVSPVFQSSDMFMIAQVSAQHAPGPPSREEVADQLKQIADVEHRVQASRPRADQVAAALKAGTPLEDAAKAAGLSTFPVVMTRAQPDQRLQLSPEILGMLWGAPQGKVVGPVETPAGWYFARKSGVSAPPDSLWNDQVKGQITTDVLSRRQRAFFEGYLNMLRAQAKVQDHRAAFGAD